MKLLTTALTYVLYVVTDFSDWVGTSIDKVNARKHSRIHGGLYCKTDGQYWPCPAWHEIQKRTAERERYRKERGK